MAAFQAKYPLRDMTDVGDYFFLPGVTKDMTRYFTKRGKQLGIQLTVEYSWMENNHGVTDWAPCDCSHEHAMSGVKVTRVA